MTEQYKKAFSPAEEEFDEELEDSYSIRVMEERDLARVIEIDRRAGGLERPVYFEEKFASCVREPGINTSLVAETDDHPVGFLIGQLFFGEFGIPSTRAVLHTIGVHPSFSGRRAAHALLRQYRRNMTALRVEAIHTLVGWDRFELLGFFNSMGFRPSREMDLIWDLSRFPFRGKNSPVTVTVAEEADLAGINGIDLETLHVGRPHYFQRKLAAAQSRPEKNIFLLGRMDDEIAGFLIANIYQGEFGIETRRGVIDSFGVVAKYRQLGVASGLLEHLLGWLMDGGAGEVETLCRWNDWNVLEFLEYVGFRPSSRINLEWRLQ